MMWKKGSYKFYQYYAVFSKETEEEEFEISQLPFGGWQPKKSSNGMGKEEQKQNR